MDALHRAEALVNRRDTSTFSKPSTEDIDVTETISALAKQAFEAADEKAQFACHRLLYKLYNLNVVVPRPGSGHAQSDPLLLSIRQEIERLWMQKELEQIDAPRMRERSVEECISYIRHISLGSGVHPLFSFMQQTATKAQIKEYFICDHLLNNRFYDIIALSLVGIDPSVRTEVARNFWDEAGQGDPAAAHTHLLREVAKSAGIEDEIMSLEQDPALEQLEGYNLLMLQATNRSEYYRSVGSLAVMELTDPQQYMLLLEGCKRIGLDGNPNIDLRYYSEHVTVDAIHGEGWLDNVVRPLVLAHDDAAQHIVEGCLLRSRSSRRYWQWVLSRMELRAD